MRESGFPLLETARLTLRKHRLDDLDDCIAMWSDPIVTKYIGGNPSSPQQTWARLLGYAGHWSVMRFGYWAVEEKATGAFVGEIGFADFRRDIAPAMRDVPELGWALASNAHGKGYATEAARAVVAWGDAHLPASRTVCLIDPENAASLRVAQKCGYEIFERAAFNNRPILFLARTRGAKAAEGPGAT
jgi:RimJ/RimL family protein N-acetyltransferase